MRIREWSPAHWKVAYVVPSPYGRTVNARLSIEFIC